MQTEILQVGPILMGLVGGLALFLFGMEQMTAALKTVAGPGMKTMLARLTTNRFKAALTGAFVTAVIQSSSVTTVLVVGFISAGLLSLSQSIGIIMGANIGTTITAQIIAFKITHYALLLIAVGFASNFLSKNENLKQYGLMMMGLGLIFLGMDFMSNATRPLRSYGPFIALMKNMQNPLAGILLGTVFTALVQSSSATTGVVIVLAGQGFITLEAGIALAFGANLGTCITALLATLGKPTEAVQAAISHVLFNVLGILVWFFFIDQLAEWVRAISPQTTELTGIAKLAAETPRQIANAHTIFNVANTLLFIGFTTPLAKFVQRITTQKKTQKDRPIYLNEVLLQTPDLAFDLTRMELGRQGVAVVRMVQNVHKTIMTGNATDLEDLKKMDNDVDALHGALVTYLGRLSQENLTQQQSEQLHDFMSAANYMENIGDIIETNLVTSGQERLQNNLQISAGTQEVFHPLTQKITWAVEKSIESLVSANRPLAEEVENAKEEINGLAEKAERHLTTRLTAEEPERLVIFRLESEIVEYLKRVYYFAKRIAKVTIEIDTAYTRPRDTKFLE
ncbi:MAG: Na/Pi cotransporter family protein [Candidatus Latescibacteria bacterium]|jgi:phosphate:Na+ symporter|nr:Na/Pi cotransporter family protein [Candidatus Latescibacterota bacterium]MBT5830995.1 Na/Pi cotransporter family protein [Candidatus Latescibacterota bacterium]